MVDVGSAQKRKGTVLAHLPSHIPASIIPLTSKQQRKYRPDAVMVIRHDAAAQGAFDKDRDTLVILEFKFCADTFYPKQITEHTYQHQHDDLIRLLREHGWKNITTHHIRMGVGGSVFSSALQTLMRLGVSKKHAWNTMKSIHIYSIQHLSSMINTRQHFYKHNLHPH